MQYLQRPKARGQFDLKNFKNQNTLSQKDNIVSNMIPDSQRKSFRELLQIQLLLFPRK